MTSASTRLLGAAVTLIVTLAVIPAFGQQSGPLTVDLNKISSDGIGAKIGSIEISEKGAGVSFKVALSGLAPGKHGFHVHETGSCEPGTKDGKRQAGIAAGDHFDPDKTKSHSGPHGKGHKGDLPLIQADNDKVEQTVVAPRLKLADIRGRALVIHEGGDNYSDQPENGGGQGRIACAVIPAT